MTEREKMLAGAPYLASDRELNALHRRAVRLCREYNQTVGEDEDRRAALLRELLGTTSRGVYIEPPFFCDYGRHLHLGEKVYMNFNCVVLDCNHVRIGARTMLGPGVHIYAATHPLDAAARAAGPELAYPVTIGADVWIGGRAVICPGVTIGDGTTIGAGSVVTRDVPAGVFAAGNPCRVIRTL